MKRLPDGKILHLLLTPSLMGYGSDSIRLFPLGNSCFTIMFTYDTEYHQVQVGLHYNHKKPITFRIGFIKYLLRKQSKIRTKFLLHGLK